MPTQELAASFGRLAGNHLWQSTGFAAGVVLLAWALRGNHARTRYWLWLAASVKFLVPFSVLAAVGGGLGRWFVPAAPVSRVPLAVEQIVQPFAPIQDAGLAVASVPATANPLPVLLLGLWFCGFVAVVLYGWARWRRVAVAVRSAKPLREGPELEAWCSVGKKAGQEARPTGARRRFGWGGPPGLPSLVSSSAKLEPGVFGIFRPVLWLPASIGDRLEDAELEAILAHELCHIRRRDNLFAAIHMAVEAIFWFHPLVWWLGARLEEERERACDEEVVRMGGEPQIYAESILKVCEFYLASPVACAAGVTGGELKKRIEGIMTDHTLRNLSIAKRLLLAVAALAVVVFPIALEIARAQAQAGSGSERPSFDVVSVKQDHTGEVGGAGDWVPGTHGPSTGSYRWTRINVLRMIADAYDVKWDQVVGIPKMLQGPGTVFNIDAKFPAGTTTAQFRLMLQSLLADRFHFSMHRETRQLPAIALEVAKGGPKLKPASGDCVEHPAKSPPDEYRCGVFTVLLHPAAQGGPGEMVWEYAGRSVSMTDIAEGFRENEPVVDATGIRGLYDIDVKIQFRPAPASDDPEERRNNQLDFQANFRASFEKQAGLIVDLGSSKKLPVPVIVVDHMEMPTPN
jgi:uncharacterized protein (TIGR03435 family)